MRRFKIERDEFGDISKYILNENIYIKRELAMNCFARTLSFYYLYKDNKIIMESGYGTGYSLKDLKAKALELI